MGTLTGKNEEEAGHQTPHGYYVGQTLVEGREEGGKGEEGKERCGGRGVKGGGRKKKEMKGRGGIEM